MKVIRFEGNRNDGETLLQPKNGTSRQGPSYVAVARYAADEWWKKCVISDRPITTGSLVSSGQALVNITNGWVKNSSSFLEY